MKRTSLWLKERVTRGLNWNGKSVSNNYSIFDVQFRNRVEVTWWRRQMRGSTGVHVPVSWRFCQRHCVERFRKFPRRLVVHGHHISFVLSSGTGWVLLVGRTSIGIVKPLRRGPLLPVFERYVQKLLGHGLVVVRVTLVVVVFTSTSYVSSSIAPVVALLTMGVVCSFSLWSCGYKSSWRRCSVVVVDSSFVGLLQAGFFEL